MTFIRSFVTVTVFAAFVLLWIWAWSKQRKSDFDAAAQLPLLDSSPDNVHEQAT